VSTIIFLKLLVSGGLAGESQRKESIHHSFDQPSNRALRPGFSYLSKTPSELWASQSPLDKMYLATEGGGAAGTPGYLALPGENADEFYAESTPYWWVPSQTFDLRGTRVSFYLKEIRPISVAAGYEPRLFVADYVPGGGYGTSILKQPLKVGKNGEWVFNELELKAEPSLWIENKRRDIGVVLSQVGFIGVSYHDLVNSKGAHATGILGIDEFKFNIHAKKTW
jgi:hypothetical protein